MHHFTFTFIFEQATKVPSAEANTESRFNIGASRFNLSSLKNAGTLHAVPRFVQNSAKAVRRDLTFVRLLRLFIQSHLCYYYSQLASSYVANRLIMLLSFCRQPLPTAAAAAEYCCDRFSVIETTGQASRESISLRYMVGRYGNLSLLSKDEFNCIVNYLATY